MSQYKQRKKQKGIKAKMRRKRYQKKRSIWKSARFRFILWGVILAILLGYLLLFSSVFAIKDIKINGISEDKADLTAAVYDLAQKNINRPFLGFFKIRSFFLLNTKNIQAKIKQDFPIIEEANINKKPPSTIVITLKERQRQAILCDPELVCYFVDKTGVVFQKIQAGLQDTNLPLVLTSNSADYSLSQKALTEEQVSEILAIADFFQNQSQIPLEHFTTDCQTRLNAKTKEGWEAYFSFENDLKTSLIKLGLLIEKNLTPDKRKNLQYIDLRFSKVYYK